MRLHGISRDAFDRYSSTKPSWQYEVIAPGFKYNMTDLAAALGIQQLRKAQRFQQRRAEMAARYDKELAGLPLTLPPKALFGQTHAWHLYVIRLGDAAAIPRDVFIERMSALGIGCSVHFIPLHLHPYWRDTYNLTPADFPASTHVFERSVSLPIYTRMTDADQSRVIAAVNALLE